MMNVGCSRHCITPQFDDFYLIGYRDPVRFQPASGVHDDIFSNALLLRDDAGEELFVFSADVLEFEESMAEDVKTLLARDYGIDRDYVLLCATHDHSSVVGYHRSWYTGKFDQRYYDFFLGVISTSLEECRASARPATARMGQQEVLGFYGNRNHADAPADNMVTVLEFVGEDGTPFAGLVNWATHSTVLPGSNTWLTADLAGSVSKLLGSSLGYYPAMIVGAAGDCSNRFFRQGRDFAELERESTGLAERIAQIPRMTPVKLGDICCQTVFHTIHHDMSFVHETVRAEIERLSATQEDRERNAGRIADLERRLEVNSFHLDAKAWVFDLGGLQLVAFPGELGSAFGRELRDACPVPQLLAGYANGYYEYFMPRAEYGLSFETVGSPIPPGEPELMVAKIEQASRLLLG